MKTIARLLWILLTILAASCATTPEAQRHRMYGKEEPSRPVLTLERHARSFLGTPYHYGGSNRRGMDCSGFVMRVFRDVYDMQLPHSAKKLFDRGRSIGRSSLRVGDLVFFKNVREAYPSHVGISLGKNRFIHASVSSGVIVSSLKESYYKSRYIGAKRIR